MTTDPTNVVALGKGDFFAIDRRTWGRVLNLGMGASAAYLILARGTLSDMRSTSWSVNAIEQRTAIGRPRIQKALQDLKQAGLIQQTRGGTKPRYYLPPFDEIGGKGANPLTVDEQALIAKIGRGAWVPKVGRWDGSQWGRISTRPYEMALRLAERGFLKNAGGQNFTRPPEAADPGKPDWVWLPNDLVDGAAEETPPLERVRQSQRVPAIRLLIDLYHAQSLQVDGGVHWRAIRQEFERTRIGQQGPYTVWGFRKSTRRIWGSLYSPYLTGIKDEAGRDTGLDAFWGALDILERCGLVEFVAHLVDVDSDEGAVIHPCAYPGSGEPEERSIGGQAHLAGRRMLSPEQLTRIEGAGLWLVPVQSRIPDVALLGLVRLRYRARTTATANWYTPSDWAKWADRYSEMAVTTVTGQRLDGSVIDPAMQHQR